MSLYYGHSSKRSNIAIPRSNDFFTTFTYAALNTSDWCIPLDLRTGHPKPIPYVGKYITKDTSFTLMEWTFDKDGTITNLISKLYLVIYDKSGATFGYDLPNFDVSANMLPITTRYVSVIDKTYKLSDFHQDYENIVIFYVKPRKLSGTDAGYESAMTVRISY